jgi:arylsulfatase A-like enzyme
MGRWRLRALLPALAAMAGLYLTAAVSFARAGDARTDGLTRLSAEAEISQRVLRPAVALFDADGDGFPTALCSAGCDCDDTDPSVNPGALDEPDNGIDEDCSGADLSRAELAQYASVFAKPQPAARPPAPASPPPDPARERPTSAAGAPDKVHTLAHRTVSTLSGVLPGLPSTTAPTDSSVGAAGDTAAGATPVTASAGAPAQGPLLQLSRDGLPNILLVTIDTVRADHMSLYGYERETTPRLRAWADQGAVVFEQARVTGPSTRFSVAPFLLSKHFTEIARGRHEWPEIAEEETFLAERLKALGYSTAAFHSIRYFRPMYKLDQGFDHYSVKALDERGPPLNMISSDFITDEALAYVDKAKVAAHQPFFLWAYYGDPHSAYMRHKGFSDFGPKYTDLYDGEIAFTDHHVGRLFDGLAKRGLMKDTIVVVVSDHGEGLDPAEDHGTRYHSKNLYDELLRVPFLLAAPGVPPQRVETSVSLLDLVPTLMDLLGQPLDPELRGVSLVPTLRGERPPHPPVFAEKHRKQDEPQKAMILWPYKVIMVLPYMNVEIYDLAKDPREREDLADTLPEAERDRLVGLLKHWQTHILKPHRPNYRH